jgi:hypothetical protein
VALSPEGAGGVTDHPGAVTPSKALVFTATASREQTNNPNLADAGMLEIVVDATRVQVFPSSEK